MGLKILPPWYPNLTREVIMFNGGDNPLEVAERERGCLRTS